jgi:hypothetical protein
VENPRKMTGFFLKLALGLFVLFFAVTAKVSWSANQTVLTENQASVGCTVGEDGILSCPGPGTGLCWAKGHNPYFDESPLSVDIGNPGSENFGREELCSVTPDRSQKISPKIETCEPPCF